MILIERGEGVETKQIKTAYSSNAGTAYITYVRPRWLRILQLANLYIHSSTDSTTSRSRWKTLLEKSTRVFWSC